MEDTKIYYVDAYGIYEKVYGSDLRLHRVRGTYVDAINMALSQNTHTMRRLKEARVVLEQLREQYEDQLNG